MIERSQKMRVSRIEPADSQPKSPGGAAIEATWRGTLRHSSCLFAGDRIQSSQNPCVVRVSGEAHNIACSTATGERW